MKSQLIIFLALLLSVYSCQNTSNSNSGSNDIETVVSEVSSDFNNKDSLLIQLADDNSLLIITDLFLIKFPGTMDYPLTKEVDNITETSTIDIKLFVIYCSEMFQTEFTFYPLIEDIEITKIEQQYSSTLFFSEDGSGGTWEIDEVSEVSSDWLVVEQLDEYIFRTLSTEVLDETKSEISEKSFAVADEYIQNSEVTASYFEASTVNRLKIFWKTAEGDYEFIINFVLQQGD